MTGVSSALRGVGVRFCITNMNSTKLLYGAMEAHPVRIKAYPWAMVAHRWAMVAYPGAMEAYLEPWRLTWSTFLRQIELALNTVHL